MKNVRLDLTIDDRSSKGLDALPRSLSASAFMRVMLRAISMSEREFEKYKAESREAQQVREYLRDKTRLGNIRGLIL